MIEVKINNKTIEKNLKFFTIESNTKYSNIWTYCFPNNSEFLKYWKYRKYFIFDGIRKGIDSLIFENEDEFKNLIDYQSTSFCDEHDYIIFEFPDDYPEEDLFYFKMKYC